MSIVIAMVQDRNPDDARIYAVALSTLTSPPFFVSSREQRSGCLRDSASCRVLSPVRFHESPSPSPDPYDPVLRRS